MPDFVSDAKSATAAGDYVRAILRKYPAMKAELRDLLWQIDSGQGVNVSALPDAKLKGALRGLFAHLRLRCTKQARPQCAPAHRPRAACALQTCVTSFAHAGLC